MNRFLKAFNFCILVLFIIHSGKTFAQCVWNPAPGATNWDNASNWSCGHVPGPSDDVVINNNVTFSSSGSTYARTVNSLSITCSYVQFGMKFTGLSVSGISSTSPAYTLKISSTNLVPEVTSFVLNVTGNGPVIINNGATLGNVYNSSTKYTVNVTNARTGGDDVSDQSVIVSGTSPNVTINGNFNCTSTSYKFSNVVFNKPVSITKTGSLTSLNSSNNTFANNLTIVNNGSGNISWGNNDLFTYATGQVTINNNSTGTTYIASAANASVSFPCAVTANNSSTGKIVFSDASTNTVNFNSTSLKDVWFYNSSSGEVQISNLGAVNFTNSNVLLGNIGGGKVYTGYGSSSNAVIIDGTSKFNVNGSSGAGPYCSSGELHFDRLKLNFSSASYSSIISLGSSASIKIKSGCEFHRNTTVNAYRFIGIGGWYNYPVVFNRLSGAALETTDTYNLLKFENNVSFINNATSVWNIGGIDSPLSTLSNNSVTISTYSGNPRTLFIVQTNSTGDIVFGYNPSTVTITDCIPTLRRNTATAGSIYMGKLANINVVSTNLANSSTRCDLTIEQFGSVTGTTPTISLGSATSGSGFGTFTYNGVLVTTNFAGGCLTFGRFTANCNVNATVGSSPDASTLIYLSMYGAFNKDTYMKGPNISCAGGTYGSVPVSPPYIPSAYTNTTTFYRTAGSSTANYAIGTPVFNSSLAVYNLSSGLFAFGYTIDDVFNFNSNVALYRSGSGDVRTSNFGTSYYKGNYTYYGDPFSTAMAGISVFNGLVNQSIFCVSLSQVLRFNNLEINKPDPISPDLVNNVTLSSAIAVGGTNGVLKLTKGNFVTSSSALLTVENGAVITGGSSLSFVQGPLAKQGTIPATTPFEFKFHIGKTKTVGTTVTVLYMPVSITMPISSASVYTAEFFNVYQTVGNSLASGIADVQRCQYWTLSHSGPTESISLTLPWNGAAGQTCYPVNPDVVCVAQYNGTSWQNTGANVSSAGTTGTVKSDVLTTDPTGTAIYFSLGYLNALVIDTKATNLSPYTITGACEPLPETYYSSLDGTMAGDKTIVSNSYNAVEGYLVIHPTFSSEFSIAIGASIGANNEPLTVKVTTNASGVSPVVNTVKTDEGYGAGFEDLSPNFYSKATNQLVFYKSKPDETVNELTHNLADGVTFEVNKYTTNTPTVPFQLAGIPSGVSLATLSIYYNGTTLVTQNTTTLSWDGIGTTGTYNGLLCPEGLYTYDLVLNVASQDYNYSGQLILKYK